jgi:glycosyltransferase involved in cell wall biosynthesis
MPEIIKVLHVTTHDEECGIAKYQEQFLVGMKPLKTIVNKVFPYSPNKTKVMTQEELAPVLKEFAEQVAAYDIVHFQHEFSFYSGDELDEMVSEAKHQGKKVLITVHTTLDAGFPTFNLKDLRRIRTLLGKKQLSSRLTKTHVVPMRKADVVFVHNGVVEQSLIKRGVSKRKIQKVTMPVPVVPFDLKSTDITKHLNKTTGDVIYCTVGFLSETKGMKHAVRALTTPLSAS